MSDSKAIVDELDPAQLSVLVDAGLLVPDEDLTWVRLRIGTAAAVAVCDGWLAWRTADGVRLDELRDQLVAESDTATIVAAGDLIGAVEP